MLATMRRTEESAQLNILDGNGKEAYRVSDHMGRPAQVLSPAAALKALLTILLYSANSFAAEIMYEEIVSMGSLNSLGSNPQARLLAGPDGALYGTTYQGGSAGRGTIFAIKGDGSGFRLLHQFRSVGDDGRRPYADLVFGSDGAIYGTTEMGGTNDGGTIFRIRPDGSDYQVLFRFFSASGYWPRGQMLEAPDGYLYSTTQYGGPDGVGTVYRIRPDGSGFQMLHSMDPGGDADTGLTLGSDGRLFGVTSLGGVTESGTIFRVNRDGTDFQILHQFQGLPAQDGIEPDGRLLELSDGLLYGTTERGGIGFPGFGIIYRISKDGTGYEVLRRLNPTNGDPAGVTSELIQGSDGALYSTTSGSVFKIRPDGSGVEVLHRFVRGPNDGFFGRGVEFGANGVLYGATQVGGLYDQGILYSITFDTFRMDLRCPAPAC
jgi:uncharacterized repeat protein (TIGR03803 family)